MKWFASTAASSLLLFAVMMPQPAGAADPVDAANASIQGLVSNTDASGKANSLYYDKVAPGYTSGKAMNDTALKPMTNAAPLQDFSGNVLGNVGLMTPSTKPLMTVSLVPDFVNGEINRVIIAQDLDVNGTLEYSETIGGSGTQIVGVCGNGIVLCPPGSYGTSACSYELWSADGNGGITISSKLTGTSSVAGDLFNCYCFSNHCARFNNAAVQNLGKITQEIGGDILAKFMEVRPDLIVSTVSVNDTVASYYGTRTSTSMSQADGFTAPKKTNRNYDNLPVLTANTPDATMAQYPNLAGLDALAATENAAMGSIPDSLFNLVNNLQKNENSITTTCVNQRSITLSAKNISKNESYPRPCSGGAFDAASQTCTASAEPICPTGYVFEPRIQQCSIRVCTDHYYYSKIMTSDNLTFDLVFAGGWPSADPTVLSNIGWNCGGVWDSPFSLLKLTPPTSTQTIGAQASQGSFACDYFDPGTGGRVSGQWFSATGASPWSVGSLTFGQSGAQAPFSYNCSMTIDYTIEENIETVSKGCASLETDSTCKVLSEKWDNRPYITNYLETGFQMAQICTDYPGVLRNYKICRPWMRQEKVFVCDRTQANNFDSYLLTLRDKVKSIQDTVAPAANQPPDSCEQACKVKVARKDTLVRYGGAESDVKRSDSVTDNQFDYYVKSCTAATGTPVCPVDASKGETIVTNCSCLNEYGEVLARSEALQKAANDVTCSKKAPN